MARIWSEENKLAQWLNVEILACEAQAKLGLIPQEALEVIRRKARFDPDRVLKIEEQTRHDVVAFLTNIAEEVGPEARYIHRGMTSSDVLDTGLALQMKGAGLLILKGLQGLAGVLKRRALEHKHTAMIGRTHGMHAEPITFGLKLLVYLEETIRHIARWEHAVETISCGKISGVVGTYAHLDPSVEEYVCTKLGLKPARISTQILQRDRHAEYVTVLALIAASLEKFALEVRHLQRSEVGEASEYFAPGQKGSSAMPHKRNPIICERICGLARLVRGNAQVALENVALWHERDISHSSAERAIIPDSTVAVDYMLHLATDLFDRLIVFPERMLENLRASRGTYASQRLLLALIERGVSREEAYPWVQRDAQRALDDGRDFLDVVLEDDDVRARLPETEIKNACGLESYLRHVDLIFSRFA
jgi:adenylosuccinate lyase